MAVVKVDVAGERLISAAEGNGPVNASTSRCADLGKYRSTSRPEADRHHVRILNGGTEAVTRVLIERRQEGGAGPRSACHPTSSIRRFRR
jgi:2-isopropylmalate synthase